VGSSRVFGLVLLLGGCLGELGKDDDTTPPDSEVDSPTDTVVGSDSDVVVDSGPTEDEFADCEAVASADRIVAGDFMVETADDAAALRCVERVQGSLTITGDALVDVPDNLVASVGGDVRVEVGNALTGFSLRFLRDVGGDVLIDETHERSGSGLAEFALPSLERIGGELILSDLRGVQRLKLGRLTSINDAVEINVHPDAQVLDLSGLESVGGSVYLSHVPPTLQLQALSTLSGDLRIGEPSAPASQPASTLSLPELSSVGGHLLVRNQPGLQSISIPKLPGLTHHLQFELLEGLTSIDMGSLVNVREYVLFRQLPELTSLTMPSLTTVGSILSYDGVSKLTQLPHMPALASVGALNVYNCTELQVINYPALSGDMDDIHVEGNAKLTSVSGFDGVTSVDFILFDGSPDGSTSFTVSGFAALSTVDWLYIDTPYLTSVSGFGALTHVGELYVDAVNLANLEAFSSLTSAEEVSVNPAHLCDNLSGITDAVCQAPDPSTGFWNWDTSQ